MSWRPIKVIEFEREPEKKKKSKKVFPVKWCPVCERAWQNVNDYLNDFPKISCRTVVCYECKRREEK